MLAIGSPYPQFFDLDGRPLDAGFIYVGMENQDPETSPITVYWDIALTQPATQPLRTLNGMIARSGTPAFVYAAVDHSMTVRNSRGVQVVYAPSSAAFSVAGQLDELETAVKSPTGAQVVGFIQNGPGAIVRTLADKGYEIVSPGDFGQAVKYTVKVPSDYPTLQAAFTALAPGVFKPGQLFEIMIEAGHRLTAGLLLFYGDYSNFVISSEDAIVTLAPGFAFVTSSNFVMSFWQCHAPRINVKIDAAGAGGGGYAYNSSKGKVEQQKGFLNSGGDCLYINSDGNVDAFRTQWNGGANLCAWVSRCSTLDAEESSFNDGGNVGITIRRGSRANITNSTVNGNANSGVICTRSYVNFQGREDASGPASAAYCSNNGDNGIVVTRGSQATLTGVTAQGNGQSGVLVSSGSTADCDGATITGNPTAGIRAIYGAMVSAASATLTGNGRAIICIGAASSVDADSANLSNSTSSAIQCFDGARVSAADATGNNAGSIAIECRDGGYVAVPDGIFNDCLGTALSCNNAICSAPRAQFRRATTEGVRVISGTVYFQGGDARRTDGTTTTADMNITNGSILHANGALGGYAVAIVPNTNSGNRGILWGA